MSKKPDTAELLEEYLSDESVEIIDLDTEPESAFRDTDAQRIVHAKLAVLAWQRSFTKKRIRDAAMVASALLALLVFLANFHMGLALFNGLVVHLQLVFFP